MVEKTDLVLVILFDLLNEKKKNPATNNSDVIKLDSLLLGARGSNNEIRGGDGKKMFTFKPGY